MTRDEIIAVIADAVREETDEPGLDIGPRTTALEVPGWDSLAHVRIILNVGVRLHANIDISKTYLAANVGDLADIVQREIADQVHPS
ncbi:hypothetical protein CWB41_07225 [Methylovirgula ligni]|uniref:Acyl carrier protein n=1 Tax=Methylovirgula ligni TaxID=569860 RepID=A0A3D9Z2Q0_9HYPH|nr:hypothetical protein [Methylovirgula ligni]QAY95553.1 hypothetical protein CWB41_07225 [Methylovirgula ligni]REF89105.1 acyl carrier protein [Methylovirgula ligni]